MVIITDEVKNVFDIANALEYIGCEYEKFHSVLDAFVDFTGAFNDKIRLDDIQCRPEHFQMLVQVIYDYAAALQGATEELTREAYALHDATRAVG